MNQNENSHVNYTPDVKRNRGISALWLLPILSLILAGWLVFKAMNNAGEIVQIRFSSAQGLVEGRTTIRYQGLEVGVVKDILFTDDFEGVFVTAEISPDAVKLLTKSTRFWLVKPTASLTGISGLDALVSGNYIAIQPGFDKNDDLVTKFTALEGAPSDIIAKKGLNIVLRSKDLGSISVGSQIVYKKIPIGEVYGYNLDDSNKSVLIRAVIEDEYQHLITKNSRFWDVSGIHTNVGFSGLDVSVESFSAIINGAIAVDSTNGGETAEQNSEFNLYPDLKTAGRGIAINITLPQHHQINDTDGTPIMYKGLEIGQITTLSLDENRETVIASAAIQPAFSDMLNSGSRFILEEAKISLAGVENMANLVRGNYLTIVPGLGEKSRNFEAVRIDQYNHEQNRALSIQLQADSSYGLDVGSQVLYRGLNVGTIAKIKLVNDRILFDLLIDNQYAYLIKSKNKFFVTSSASAELTSTGLSVTTQPVKQLLTGSITFISEGDKNVKPVYQLYKSGALAELAKQSNNGGEQTILLFAHELPPITEGSPLLYRNLPVGKISGYKLIDNGVQITALIENQYRYLLNDQSVFWNYSGVSVDASLAGIEFKAAPLKALLQGGIAFDTLTDNVENKVGNRWKLYGSLKEAQKFGHLITLKSIKSQSVNRGMQIKYHGVNVGEIVEVTPNFKENSVNISARIHSKYVNNIARKGSHFWIASPKISLMDVQNIDSIINTYINVEPNPNGEPSFDFELSLNSNAQNSVIFTLQSDERHSINVGTPVLYRGIQVGVVTNVAFGDFADRIISTIEIEQKYAYLIRNNTLFWNTSGFDVTVGLSGANIKTGTVDSLVKGGISFATPEEKTLQPAAKERQTFYLYPQAEDEWKTWRKPIPNPNK